MTTTFDETETSFEERLRRELLAIRAERFGMAEPRTPLQVPHRYRRSRVLVAAAISAVVATGIWLAIALIPSGGASHSIDAVLVVQRTRIAVASAANEIEHVQVTNSAADTGDTNSSSDAWYYGAYGRFENFNAAGSPLITRIDTPTSSTLVDYSDQEYWQEPPRACASTATGCTSTFSANPSGGTFPPVAQVEQEIADGTFTVSGPTEVDGQQGLELTQSDNGATVDVWVDPSTYLPFKAAWTWTWRVQTSTITWLQPTAANMTTFSATAPAGFTLVPEPVAPTGCPGLGGGRGRPSAACVAELGGNSGTADNSGAASGA